MVDFLLIPESKFAHPQSCYSFIFRYAIQDSRLEIYLPPFVELKKDLADWLNEQGYERQTASGSTEIAIAYTAVKNDRNLKATKDLVAKASQNGAFRVDDSVVSEKGLKDFDNEPLNNSFKPIQKNAVRQTGNPLVDAIATQTIELIDERLKTIIDEVSSQASLAVENKSRIEQLESSLAEKDREIEAQAKQIAEYESLLQIDPVQGKTAHLKTSNLDLSPFAVEPVEDYTYLSSPFKSTDNEVLNAADYDEKEMNENLAPAKLDPAISESLETINLADLEKEDEKGKAENLIPQDLDFNAALKQIDTEELATANNSKGKTKKEKP